MPPSPENEEDDAPSPSTPAAKRKVSNNATPRRASQNKAKPSTPIRKVSGNAAKTPNTAPARTKTGNTKKGEPTLLGDFLLGRPTPGRQQQQRRKSLDAVKLELKAANVGSIKVPGGVKDRVKQWQKANAAAVVAEADPNEQTADEEKAAKSKKPPEGVDGQSVDEDERLRIKHRGAKRPGRRKSKEEVRDENASEVHSRSTSTPRKRVVSDEHWKKDRTPKKKSPRSGSQRIPKDFLAKTAATDPVGHRVQEWMKISEAHATSDTEHGDVNRPLRHELKFPKEALDDGIRVRPLPGSSRSAARDVGVRGKPRDESPPPVITDDGIRVKPIRKEASKRKPRETETVPNELDIEDEVGTPTRRQEKRLRPPAESVERLRATSNSSRILDEEYDEVSALTPTASTKSKRKARKSDTPSDLSEIPFGNSAFSVLELPVGAEAGTMPSKRPPPKRTPSFGVPKVLKKVYNAVHDVPEPPRGGPNQPASIESWLNGTSDPFVDRPTPPQSVIAPSEATPSRSTSYRDVTTIEEEPEIESDTNDKRRHNQKLVEKVESKSPPQDVSSPPAIKVTTRDSLPSMERQSPLSPGTLKRSPATRNISSPKSGRKQSLKESIFDAFKGESSVTGPKGPHPFAEITGSREKKEILRSPSYSREPIYEGNEDVPEKESSREIPVPEPQRSWHRPLPPVFRGPPPVGGGHRLSTIASVETFSTSTGTDTASEVSQTTITQDTVLSATTISSLSRKSNNKPSEPGLKRRLTKHSDLMSVLSLPDSGQPGRATSIRSARSVRTTRTKLETATVQDIMREIAEDEAKYMRELKTLVDGVIPVLLTCVLSKSDSAKAAGLFNPNYTSGNDSTFTKPIVDMGVALERLKSLHRRIPLDSPDAFITWAGEAQKSYRDYVVAWRTGFQDVVVNLAPLSHTSSGEKSALDELPRNSAGDVIGANGERVDVAHLMKRPLVRTKYINKAIKGLSKIDPSCQRKSKACETWEDLEAFVRKRAKEEEARRVDQAANSTDSTRARDPRTFAPAENVRIDQTRQVFAQDLFSFDISHSNGQQMSCQVEILLRDKASDPKDCDIMICEVDSIRRFLLFPPLSKDNVSARLGDNKNELVVMIRGVHDASEWSEEWREVFVLENDEEEVITDWLQMLGTVPVPPAVVRKPVDIDDILSEISESIISMREPPSPTMEIDVPVGERRRREAEEIPVKPRPYSSHSRATSTPSTPTHNSSEVSDHVTDRIVDLNDAMDKAGSMQTKRARAARYHSKSKSVSTAETYLMSGGLNPYPKADEPVSGSPLPTAQSSDDQTKDIGSIPTLRPRSLPTTPKREIMTTPLKESMRSQVDELIKQRNTIEPVADQPPPPPPHRSPTPSSLKSTPVLDSATPKIKRRSSSPLKHEYQPSNASDTTSEELFYSDSDSYSESSDEDELEGVEMAHAATGPSTYGTKRISPSGSMYSIPNSTLAPSNSASQGPYRGVPIQRPAAVTRKNMASISGWDNRMGRWVDLHKDPCSIVVTPGLIQAFEMSAAHSSPTRDQLAGEQDIQTTPLLAQVVTPMVPLRQSNALDIEIRIKPNAGTTVKKSPDFVTIRYRAATTNDASMLYLSLHRARLENPVWLKLEEERRVNCFGTNQFRQSQNQRSSWSFFKRRKSYRASTRAPSVAPTEESGKSGGSSFLQRLTGGGGEYNIAKSTVHGGAPGSTKDSSAYVSNPSDYSGNTPPRTPSSPSVANSSYSQAMLKNRGTEDLAIRLYQYHSATKWEDMGPARLTVTLVPQGMRQASSLNHGIERRIIVTRKASSSFFNSIANNFTEKSKLQGEYYTFMDMVLGADCFQIIGRTGVCATVWEDIMGPNGEIGRVGATGGVAGRTRKWLFQTSCQADAAHIYNICAVGGRGFRENY